MDRVPDVQTSLFMSSRPDTQVRLITSWTDEDPWDPWPIPKALDQLIILTCFSSETGWTRIESRLREMLRENKSGSTHLLVG